MKRIILVMFIMTTMHVAAAQDCFIFDCAAGSNGECWIKADNLKAKLPPGWLITEVVGGTAIGNCPSRNPGEDYPVEYTNPREVSLDRKDGRVEGVLKIQGKLKTKGIIKYRPNDGGDIFFRPDKSNFTNTGAFFKYHFHEIGLPPLDYFPWAGKVPREIRSSSCWEANALGDFTDFEVDHGGGSSGGTSPMKFHISQISGYKTCDPD